MNANLSRRTALKMFTVSTLATGITSCQSTSNSTGSDSTPNTPQKDMWDKTHDRVWLGGEYWANPMEDWRIRNGHAQCTSREGNRSIHSLTHQLQQIDKPFSVSVVLFRTIPASNDGGAGIRLGIKSDVNDYKSNCFIQTGLDIGLLKNTLVLGDKSLPLQTQVGQQEIILTVQGHPQTNGVQLNADIKLANNDSVIGQLEQLVPKDKLKGNVAIVSNFANPALDQGQTLSKHLGCGYAFRDWWLKGDGFSVNQQQKFGPILWSMYTLSDSRTNKGFVMKLNAYTGPLGEEDHQFIAFQVKERTNWKTISTEKINPDGWVASFKIENWDAGKRTPYRLLYVEHHPDGSLTPDIYEGSIRANPKRRKVRMAALTGQSDYAYPYAPVVRNLKQLNPDLVYFSGQQICKTNGGYGVVKSSNRRAVLNYLRKFHQFGWAFRDNMRHQPTVCLPDAEDLLQHNLWGEGGAITQSSDNPFSENVSGYIQSPKFINTVHRTTLGHHPDSHEPTPSMGINIYYTDMVYGGVSFAIIADRHYKSAPARIGAKQGKTGQNEKPHHINPKFNPPGLTLLGNRQEAFLKQWSQDWRGHTLKAVLSQSMFASLSTHQEQENRYLKYDFASNGWPASARNTAINSMRESMALHICGDTNLGALSQYGVNQQRDSNWAFCTPAISAERPRWWKPDSMGMPVKNRPNHGLPQTGEYNDTFGNKVYVYAVANPEQGTAYNRYNQAHQKGGGFGYVIFDTKALTYTMHAFRFNINVADNNPDNQFSGWPITIQQKENKGQNVLNYSPYLRESKV